MLSLTTCRVGLRAIITDLLRIPHNNDGRYLIVIPNLAGMTKIDIPDLGWLARCAQKLDEQNRHPVLVGVRLHCPHAAAASQKPAS